MSEETKDNVVYLADIMEANKPVQVNEVTPEVTPQVAPEVQTPTAEVAGEETAQVANDNSQAEETQEFDIDAAVEAFDVTRGARKDALDQVQKILQRAVSGNRASGAWNIDKKEMLKIFRSLYVVCMMQDMLLVAIMGDMVRAVRASANNEAETFNLIAKLFTVTETLKDKGLVTAEDFEKTHTEKTLPQLMAKIQAENSEPK